MTRPDDAPTPARSTWDRILYGPYPWWLWPSALVTLAASAVAASLLFTPSDDPTRVFVLGQAFGGECGMKVALGIPCPQCGMTRSWVHLVRGNIFEAFRYNAAGALLLLWIVTGGFVGAVRLVTGRARALRPPWLALFLWAMFWLLVPYMGLWVARILGVNPLPEFG